MHPLMRVLFDQLPPPHVEWAAAERVRWLKAAAGIMGLVYPTEGQIVVSLADEGKTERGQG